VAEWLPLSGIGFIFAARWKFAQPKCWANLMPHRPLLLAPLLGTNRVFYFGLFQGDLVRFLWVASTAAWARWTRERRFSDLIRISLKYIGS